jgi:MYXO-CTERM domain-containing protein
MEALWMRNALPLALFSSAVIAESLLVTPPRAMAAAALPQGSVDTSLPAPGSVISVPGGGDLQGALNSAAPGDVIELAAGATYTGNFVISKDMGASKAWIRSSAWQSLPPQGARVSPGNAGAMARIVSPNSDPALRFDFGASGYYLTGLEVTTTSPTNFNMVFIGADAGSNGATSPAQLPDQVIVDRCYVHGNPSGNIRRGITANGAAFAVVDSYISDIHEAGSDAQAVASWNGSGPFKISNNYLEAASENVLFGGADPSISGLVPSDIEISGNNFFKPEAWRSQAWTVKNLLELKNARRVLIAGNVFEQNWGSAQTGFAIVLTPRNQNGGAPWSAVQDVTFTDNVVRNVASGINLLGTDDEHSSQQTRGIAILNNLFTGVDGARWSGDGIFMQALSGAFDVVVEHATVEQTGNLLTADGAPTTGFVFRDNIAFHNQYGVKGTGQNTGNGTLETFFPGAVFTNNVIIGPYPTAIGADTSNYSDFPGNFFPNSEAEVGFVNPGAGDFSLAPGSPYKGKATDGGDIGAQLGVASAAEIRASSTVGSFASTGGTSGGGGCSLDPTGASPERTSLGLSLLVLGLLAARGRRRRSG